MLLEKKKVNAGHGRRWLAAVAVGALAFSTVVVGAESAAASGDPACGIDVGGVHQVSTVAQLEAVGRAGAGVGACQLGAQYLQTVSLTLPPPVSPATSNWTPIESGGNNEFAGTFDGGGHTITGLTIDRPTVNFQGLFALSASNSVLKNIGLVNVQVTGRDYVGGLVGYNEGSITNSYATGVVTGRDYVGGLSGGGESITNSYATGMVTGRGNVGGLVGESYGSITDSYATGAVTGLDYVGGLSGWSWGSITSSYATGAVTGNGYVGGLSGGSDRYFGTEASVTDSYATGVVTGLADPAGPRDAYAAGGLLGYSNGSVTNSSATGAVTGEEAVGGLVGFSGSFGGSVTNSYATGAVTGRDEVGGLVGWNGDSITNSYATGAVHGQTKVGGLVGENFRNSTWANGSVENSYATGAVTGTSDVGGLVGHNTGGVSNSFWNTVTSGRDTSAGGTGLATAALQSIATFSTLAPGLTASWPIVSRWAAFNGSTQVWGISPAFNNGYPYLLWQLSSRPNVSPMFSSGITGSGVAGTGSGVYTAAAIDADGDTVAYSLAPAVAGFTIDSSTGVVSMGAGVVAGLHVLTVVASDGPASATQAVTVTVSAAPNVSPVFSSGGSGSGVAGAASSVYTAVASDADGDTVTYSLFIAPAGFTIHSSTGVVSMAASVVAGWYFMSVRASDGITKMASQMVLVDVEAGPNVSPVFSSGGTGLGVAGRASSVYTAVATDANNDTVTYSLAPAVTGFTIDSSTGVVSMGAGVAAGLHVLTVVASDGKASVTQAVTVTVVSPLDAFVSGLTLDRNVGASIFNARAAYFVEKLQVDSTWTLTVRSTPQIIASGIVDSSGTVRGNAAIPAGLKAGWHSITLTGTNILGTAVNKVLWFELDERGVILAKQDTAPVLPAVVLARTGSDIGGLSTGALALVMLGLVAVAFTRRQVRGKGLLAR